MKTLLSTLTSLVLSASLSSAAHAQTLDPSMDPNQQWQGWSGRRDVSGTRPELSGLPGGPKRLSKSGAAVWLFRPAPDRV